MGFGPLRNLVGPVARTLLSRSISSFSPSSIPANRSAVRPEFRHLLTSLHRQSPWTPPFAAAAASHFHSLTDTRLPKRRPNLKGGYKKRARSRPPAPYAVVKVQPIQPKPPKNPNEGSVQRRNEKKRRRQRREFILAEKKKRKAQLQESKRKKIIKRVERKMAAVAREKAWAQRLAELQKIEEEKKKSAV